jgi:hypothetical protein
VASLVSSPEVSQSSELGNPSSTTFPEGVLLSALRAGRASTSEVTSRTIGALIHALVAAGEAADIAGLLAPEPSAPAPTVFEAVIQPPESPDPVPAPPPPQVRTGLDLVGGLSELLAVAENVPLAELFSVSNGLRRRVLLRTGTGPLMFVYPSATAFDGDPDAGRAAAERWSAFLAPPAAPDLAGMVKEALSDFAVEIDTQGVEDAVKRLLSDAVVEVDVQAIETAVRQVMSETANSIRAEIASTIGGAIERTGDLGDLREAIGEAARQADLANLGENMTAALADTARQSDLAALNSAVSELVRRSDLRVVFNALHEALTEVVRRSDLPAVTDSLSAALTEAQAFVARASDLADVARTPDLAALENAIKADRAEQSLRAQAVEDATRDALAGLAHKEDVAAVAAATSEAVAAATSEALAGLVHKDDIAAVAAATGEALSDVARTSDLVALETAIKAGQADLADRARLIEEASREAAAGLAAKEDLEAVAGAVQQAVADIMQKVESTASEVLQATPPEVARKSDVDAVAKSVRSVDKTLTGLGESLQRQLEESRSVEPQPAPEPIDVERLADQIAQMVADQLAPQVEPDDQLGGAIVAQAALMSAGEQLQIQLEAFNDRIRSGSRALEALADELMSRERAATLLNDQLASTMEGSLSRLADRIDSRFAELTTTGLDPVLLSEVRDLTRTLRAVVRQADKPAGAGKSAPTRARTSPRKTAS